MNRKKLMIKITIYLSVFLISTVSFLSLNIINSMTQARSDNQWDVPSRMIHRIGNIKNLGFVTGPDSVNNTQERWGVGGTDLGIFFGDSTIYMAFGDSFDSINNGNFGGNWRSNVLGIVKKSDPSKGLILSSMITDPSNDKMAIQFIEGVKNGQEDGPYGGFQVTTIPTGGFEHQGNLYVTYMSVSKWGDPGKWDCNYGGFAKSEDKGQTWTKIESLRWPGKSGFVQQSPLKAGDYIYFWSIPSGRFGGVKLMRVQKNSIENFSEYEYFQGVDGNNVRIYSKGENAMNSAREIIKGPVGELSVVYNDYAKAYLITYLNENAHAIQLRYSPQPEGEWSNALTLVRSSDYPALYGAFMHPELVSGGGKKIYFAMSQFLPVYNVHWMEAEITLREITPSASVPSQSETPELTPTPGKSTSVTPAIFASEDSSGEKSPSESYFSEVTSEDSGYGEDTSLESSHPDDTGKTSEDETEISSLNETQHESGELEKPGLKLSTIVLAVLILAITAVITIILYNKKIFKK